jgi:hypothetical protein
VGWRVSWNLLGKALSLDPLNLSLPGI